MLHPCTDIDAIDAIINQAAQVYRGVIPDDCWHEPYMTRPTLLAEVAAGVNFLGWHVSGTLVGIAGLQKSRDAMLIRHAYVHPAHQGQGIGGTLLTALVQKANGPLLVGTWAAATWAVRFYERHGFRLVSPEEKDRLLARYWKISFRQRETSVVLAYG